MKRETDLPLVERADPKRTYQMGPTGFDGVSSDWIWRRRRDPGLETGCRANCQQHQRFHPGRCGLSETRGLREPRRQTERDDLTSVRRVYQVPVLLGGVGSANRTT